MDSDEISWRRVPNTVTKRMVDLSFVHKLIPSRRLCRRTKVMNSAIKHFHSFKTYEQYVKMKTTILRNLSDDSDTDDNNGFSDDDYSVLCKSDLSLTNCMTDVFTTKTDDICEAELDVGECNISDMIKERKNSRQSKNKCSNTVNIGWQKIIDKRNVKSTCSPKKNIQESKPNIPNENSNCEFSSSSFNKVVCKKDTISSVEETYNIKMYSDQKTYGINKDQNKSYTTSMEGECNIRDNANKMLNTKNCSKALEDKEKLNSIKKDLISLLNQETMLQHVDNHSANVEANFKENHSTLKLHCVNVQEESADESKSSGSLQMLPLFNDNANQPKDSGIDEDMEEECHENGKAVYAKKKKKMKDTSREETITVVIRKNVSAIETNLTNTDDLLSDIHDTLDTTDSQCTALFTNEDTNIEKKQQNKLQKVKLQPKVTCTKVIKNKYRIISDNPPLLDKCLESEVSDDHISNKVVDPVNPADNVENSISPMSKRRLQQMRRLNLTLDNESSLSEDDNEYCNTENMRVKLLNRSKEPFNLSDSEDENMGFKHASSLQNSKKLKTTKNYTFENNKKEINIYLEETYNNNNESVESLRIAKTNSNDCKDTLHRFGETKTHSLENQYKTNTWNSCKQIVHCSGNDSNSSEKNTTHERLFQENLETERISKSDETATRTTIKNSVIQCRPHNLQELMNQESLICETTLPSITLKDLQENDIFLLDIPSMVLQTDLLGRKFIVTENKLKLGKHKYKMAFNDVDHVSCVLNTGESCTDYKTVNIKPLKTFAAYEKIMKTTSKK